MIMMIEITNTMQMKKYKEVITHQEFRWFLHPGFGISTSGQGMVEGKRG